MGLSAVPANRSSSNSSHRRPRPYRHRCSGHFRALRRRWFDAFVYFQAVARPVGDDAHAAIAFGDVIAGVSRVRAGLGSETP